MQHSLLLFLILVNKQMFFQQPKVLTQDTFLDPFDVKRQNKSKISIYQGRRYPTNLSPYKKRVSCNLAPKNRISQTQQIQNFKESLRPIIFEVQFKDNMHPLRIADKNFYLRSDNLHFDHRHSLIRPKYEPLLKCNQIKLVSYTPSIVPASSQSNHCNAPYASTNYVKDSDDERSKSTHKTIESLSKKSRIHRSLVFSNTDMSYKFYITFGNNHPIVERVMKKREKFSITSQANSLINFKWTQTSDKIKFPHIHSISGFKQIVNHFQFHDQITTKSGLLRNLRNKCEREQKDQLFDMIPVTFEIDFGNLEQCEEQIKKFVYFHVENEPSKATTMKSRRREQDHKQAVEFLRKLKSIHNIKNYTYQKKEHPYSKPIFKDVYSSGSTYLWLLKPTSLNRGRGIYLFETLDELLQIFEQYFQKTQDKSKLKESKALQSSLIIKNQIQPEITKINKTIKSSSFVIQKYIQRPMLIQKRKFDIRVWVLVTHQMQVYFFKEGYIRTSCKEYETQKKDLFIHLTNNAIQKSSDEYGMFEEGNQLSFKDLETYMTKQQNQDQKQFQAKTPSNVSFLNDVLPEMKRVIAFSMNSVKKKLNLNNRKHCFELFGYDFMLDVNYKLWLIQVNTNPCIEESSLILRMLLPRMLDDALHLTVDQVFKIRRAKSEFPVSNYSDEENMWELISDLKSQEAKK